MSGTHVEPRSEQGRWFYPDRVKLALGIAVVEGIFVAVANDISQLTVFAISVPIILFYIFVGRNLDSEKGREIAWIVAASQVFAAVLCVVAWFIGPFTLILAGIFAIIALLLLASEKPAKS